MAFSPDAAFEFLCRAHGSGRLAHAYLFSGEAGSGKRLLALRLAAWVNGLADDPEAAKRLPDVHTVEPESKSRLIRVEQTRELEKALQMRGGSPGGRKVGILFDAERMNAAAANSFLKTLEEPPANSLLLLLTAHPEMLLDTILSRCIFVQLAPAARLGPTPLQQRLLDRLAAHCGIAQPGLGEVFSLVRDFTLLLAEARSAVGAEGEAELKKEEALYRQTTDGKWLEDREEYFKALGESRYLQARAALVETLLQWWGDVLRQKHGAPGLDFPSHREATAALAQRLTTPEALRRITALEGLRENINRNVQEQLAIEVAFLNAFGA